MNDGSGHNPSDPNSMLDQGYTRNAVYNMKKVGVPNVKQTTYSDALDVHYPGRLNNSFYGFGATHTNIRKHFDPDGKHGEGQPSEGAMTGKTEYASLLNKKFNEIKMNTVPE